MLSVLRFRDPKTFLDHVGGRLGAKEIRYGLILGVCSRLVGDLHEYGTGDPWFLALEQDSEISALALRTPPFEILVAAFSGGLSEISEQLVAEASSVFDQLPGVVAEPDIADRFALAWCDTHGVKIKHTMRQRVYSLSKVKSVPLSPGELRQAGEKDKDLVARWVKGFQEDTFGHIDEGQAEARAAKQVDRGEIYLWEDGRPVSIASKARPTGNAVGIGLVYTPPGLRKRGYASSCVATLCNRLLESGFRHCTLYTDLSNPTSNKIYKRIGFTEVCDSVSHTFTHAGSKPSG